MVSSMMLAWNPALVPMWNIHSRSLSTTTFNPTARFIQLPHHNATSQPTKLPMLNNNMHIATQQSMMVQ